MTHSPITVWTPHINCLFINFKLQERPDAFNTFFSGVKAPYEANVAVIWEFMNKGKWLMMNGLLSNDRGDHLK